LCILRTTALSTTAIHNKRKFGSSSKDYDPKRQWGLAPESQYEAGTTYVVSGHVVKGDNSLTSQEVMENYGREGQAKAQRMEKKREEEKALKALLQRDKEGMEAVIRARQEAERRKQREREKEKEKEKKAKAKTKTKDGAKRTRDEDEDDGDGDGLKSKGKQRDDMVDLDDDDDDTLSPSEVPKKKHKTYSADVIKHLGFDPTMVKSKSSNSGTSSTAAQKKVCSHFAIHRFDLLTYSVISWTLSLPCILHEKRKSTWVLVQDLKSALESLRLLQRQRLLVVERRKLGMLI